MDQSKRVLGARIRAPVVVIPVGLKLDRVMAAMARDE
jgi:hypothetical protein